MPLPSGLWHFSIFQLYNFIFVISQNDIMKRSAIILTVILLSILPNLYAQKMTTPKYLKRGDIVAIVATARKIDESTLQPAIKLLESWGLKVVLGKTIGREENQLAGADWYRATDFQEMIDNPEIKAIWAAKGGYGTVRIVDRVDFKNFKNNPKWIIGFSDVTVMHSHLNNMDIETIHGMMALSTRTATNQATESLRKALFGEGLSYKVAPHAFNRFGKASGEIIGGNLSVLYSILGSESDTNYDGKILFIEDLDEYLYHIDRMMMNLKRSGKLAGIKGLIIGGMTSMNDNDVPWGKDSFEIIRDIVKDYKFPVIYDFPAGHIKDNRALILGRNVSIDVTSNGANVTFDQK